VKLDHSHADEELIAVVDCWGSHSHLAPSPSFGSPAGPHLSLWPSGLRRPAWLETT